VTRPARPIPPSWCRRIAEITPTGRSLLMEAIEWLNRVRGTGFSFL
jgi:hypothetical protein